MSYFMRIARLEGLTPTTEGLIQGRRTVYMMEYLTPINMSDNNGSIRPYLVYDYDYYESNQRSNCVTHVLNLKDMSDDAGRMINVTIVFDMRGHQLASPRIILDGQSG